MKIVFFGSPEVAVPSFLALLSRGHDIRAVYTQPDRPSGRSGTPVPTPVKQAALARGVAVETPPTLRDPATQDRLKTYGADAFVVVAYGKLLPPAVLAIPRLGVLNVHPSLLPQYRGPSPVQTAILDGAGQTGVTVMLLDAGMDTGPVLAQSSPVAIGAEETAAALMQRLFELGATLLADTLEKFARGEASPQPQDSGRATVTKLLSREDGAVDWSQPAERIARMVRAYDPWPGAHTRWRGLALKLLQVRADAAAVSRDGPRAGAAGGGNVAGTVAVDGRQAFVTAGDGRVELLRVQLEGKRAVSIDEFLRGHPEFAGSVLGA